MPSPAPHRKLQPISASNFTKQIISRLKGPHSHNQARRQYPVLRNRHNYFTRSKLHGFLAQGAIQTQNNPTSAPHHYPHGPLLANHVYHSVTGVKQSLDKLINGHDKIT